jgi:O-antigen/teichoic acid export membrane protein
LKRPSFAVSSTWNLVGQALPLLVGVIAIPVIVDRLGLVAFGLLALCWTVVGYFNFFDFGFGRAVTKRVSEAAGARDRSAVAALATASGMAHATLGLIAAALLWFTATPLSRLIINAEPAVEAEAAAVLRLLALAIPAVLVSNSYRAALEGLQRFAVVNVIRVPFSSANYLVPLVGAVLGWGLEAIVAGIMVMRYLGAITYVAAYLRAADVAGFGGAELGSLLRFGGWVALSNAIIPLTVTLERYAVSGLLGPTDFAFYSAPAEVITRVLIVPTAVSAALFPLLSASFRRGAGGEAAAAIGQAVRSIMVLLAAPLAIVMLLAEPLLNLWLGAEFAAGSASVLRVLSLALFVNAIAYVASTVTEAAGRPDLVARYHVIELPLYFLLLVYIVPAYGIVGAAAAVLIRMVVMTTTMWVLSAKAAPQAVAGQIRSGFRAATLSVALLGISWLLAAHLSWPAATITATALAASYGAAVWLWVMSEEERLGLRRRLRRGA